MEPHDGHEPGDRAEDGISPAEGNPGASAGHESVAAALRELSALEQRPLAEHPDAFARTHAGLQQALSDIDDT